MNLTEIMVLAFIMMGYKRDFIMIDIKRWKLYLIVKKDLLNHMKLKYIKTVNNLIQFIH